MALRNPHGDWYPIDYHWFYSVFIPTGIDAFASETYFPKPCWRQLWVLLGAGASLNIGHGYLWQRHVGHLLDGEYHWILLFSGATICISMTTCHGFVSDGKLCLARSWTLQSSRWFLVSPFDCVSLTSKVGGDTHMLATLGHYVATFRSRTTVVWAPIEVRLLLSTLFHGLEGQSIHATSSTNLKAQSLELWTFETSLYGPYGQLWRK